MYRHSDSLRQAGSILREMTHRITRLACRTLVVRATAAALVVFAVSVTAQGTVAPVAWDTGTFSILGYDPATGEVGGAVQSRVFSVGNGVLWAEAGVGAVATQAVVDVGYGPQCLALLREGLAPEQIVKRVWENDPDPRPQTWSKQGRQFAVMNAQGEAVAFTGPKATPWAGHKAGHFCTAQGNILAGAAVVDGMVEGFEKAPGRLALRLLAA